MTEALFAVGPGQAMEAGLFSQRDPESGPLWYDGENIVFRNLGVEKMPGWVPFGASLDKVRAIAQAYVEGDQRAYYVSEDGRVRYYSSAQGIVKSIGSIPGGRLTDIETWGSWLVLAELGMKVKVWKNAGQLVDLTGQPFDWAKLLHRHQEHLLAFNTSNGGNWVEWSNTSNIEQWTAAANNSAGNLPFRDLDSDIVAVRELGPMLAVYSADSMAILRWVGRPNVFGKQMALNGIGAISRNSVISFGSRNYGINRRGIFETDGVSMRYLDVPAMSDFVAQNMDWTKAEETHGHSNELLGQLIWMFPAVDGVWRGIGFNPSMPGFTKFLGDIYASEEKSVFEYPILGLAKSAAFHQQVRNAAGNPLTFRIRTKPLDGGSALHYKLWEVIKSVGRWQNTRVRFGAQSDINQEPEWFYDQPLETNLYPDFETPFLVMEFYSDALDSDFHLTQIIGTGQITGALV